MLEDAGISRTGTSSNFTLAQGRENLEQFVKSARCRGKVCSQPKTHLGSGFAGFLFEGASTAWTRCATSVWQLSITLKRVPAKTQEDAERSLQLSVYALAALREQGKVAERLVSLQPCGQHTSRDDTQHGTTWSCRKPNSGSRGWHFPLPCSNRAGAGTAPGAPFASYARPPAK